MRQKILILIPLAFFLFLSVQLPAMPPHPGNTNPSGRERPAPVEASAEPLYKSLSRSPAAMRSSPIASGEVKVLVILADFGADLAENKMQFPVGNYLLPNTFKACSCFFGNYPLYSACLQKKNQVGLPLVTILVTLSSCPSEAERLWRSPLFQN
jgi:hypothetical protein